MEEDEELYLGILDPMPLVASDAVAFYDGQPRDSKGRFACGKRIAVASDAGITGKVSMAESLKMLEKPLDVQACDGKKLVFDNGLVKKYHDGIGRRNGSDPNRLRNIGRAVFAVKNANSGIVELPGHNPTQRQYLHKFSEHGAIVVYVEESGRVRGFIYNSHKNADKFIKNKRGR